MGIQIVEEADELDDLMEADDDLEARDEDEVESTQVPIPETKEGCTLTMNIDMEQGNINFVNVPNEIIKKVTEEAQDEEEEEE